MSKDENLLGGWAAFLASFLAFSSGVSANLHAEHASSLGNNESGYDVKPDDGTQCKSHVSADSKSACKTDLAHANSSAQVHGIQLVEGMSLTRGYGGCADIPY